MGHSFFVGRATKNPTSLINGNPATNISLLDRGLQYGDGLFETILIHKGRFVLWDEHLKRLKEGCKRLRLVCPKPELLEKEAIQLKGNQQEGVLKIMLTRGEGHRGYRIPSVQRENRILSLFESPDYPKSYWKEGIEVVICQTRLSMNPLLAGIKHLNRLEQVLARSEWDNPTIAEGLMLDTASRVISGTMSNVFIKMGKKWITPPLLECGVEGTMRTFLLKLMEKEKIQYAVRTLHLDELTQANSLFFCNSIFGIWPVTSLRGPEGAEAIHTRFWIASAVENTASQRRIKNFKISSDIRKLQALVQTKLIFF